MCTAAVLKLAKFGTSMIYTDRLTDTMACHCISYYQSFNISA